MEAQRCSRVPAVVPCVESRCRLYHVLSSQAGRRLCRALDQSCLTLCNPIDGSPPGSPVPGILQARTLEWVAISFSSA